MKKLFFISFVGFFALPNLSSAQQMMIGARGGLNFANEAYTNLPNGESISGRTLMLVGGQFDCWLNRSWAISLQVLYDQKGANSSMNEGVYPPATAAWNASYFEIPLLAKVSFGGGVVRPYIFVGPSVGFLLSNNEKFQFYSGGTSIPNGLGTFGRLVDTMANITDSTAKIDLSIVAGAGISFTFDSGMQLFLDASYAYGLNNIDDYSWDKDYGISVYSRDIRLAAGVLFPLN
jgi:hypothetical protein